MKQIIDIKNEKPQKNDLLIFNGEMWETISKSSVTARLEEIIASKLSEYEKRIAKIEDLVESLYLTINQLNKEIRFIKGED